MRLRLDPQGFAQDDIGWSIGSMWGIPRAACHPALNDEVDGNCTGFFSEYFYKVNSFLLSGILTVASLAQDDEVGRGHLVLF